MIHFVVPPNRTSAQPPFEQLKASILDQIRTGTRAAGSKLPTVRALAEALDLAPNTVARAYRELESSGHLVTRGRRGTFVAATGETTQRRAREAAAAFAAIIAELSVDPAEALEYARLALASSGDTGDVAPV